MLLGSRRGPDIAATCEPRQSSSSNDDTDLMVPLVLGSVALIAVVALAMRANDDQGRAPAARAEPVRFAGMPDQMQIERMFVQGRALARVGRCDGVHAIGNNVLKLSYEHGASYVSDPQIAPCYARFATPPPAAPGAI